MGVTEVSHGERKWDFIGASLKDEEDLDWQRGCGRDWNSLSKGRNKPDAEEDDMKIILAEVDRVWSSNPISETPKTLES